MGIIITLSLPIVILAMVQSLQNSRVDCINVPHQRVQAKIDLSDPGDEVVVKGNCTEAVSIAKDDIVIRGRAGKGDRITGIDNTPQM